MAMSAEKGDYNTFVESLWRMINGLDIPDSKELTVATAQIVHSMEELTPLLDDTDVLIFVTLGLLHEAEEIKLAHPRLKVIVLTGLLPEDRVILLSKRWVKASIIEDLVLSSG